MVKRAARAADVGRGALGGEEGQEAENAAREGPQERKFVH